MQGAYVAKTTEPGEEKKLTHLVSLANGTYFIHFSILFDTGC